MPPKVFRSIGTPSCEGEAHSRSLGFARGRLSATLLRTQVRADPGECRAYSAQIIFEIRSQPFRAGLTFGGRPSGPRIHGDCAVSFLSQPPQAVGCSG